MTERKEGKDWRKKRIENETKGSNSRKREAQENDKESGKLPLPSFTEMFKRR